MGIYEVRFPGSAAMGFPTAGKGFIFFLSSSSSSSPQPFRRGGSSKFQYHPHLLALKSQKVAGVQSEIKSQYGGFVLTGGGVSEIEALRDPQLHPSVLIMEL
jgi:hypothetical protein